MSTELLDPTNNFHMDPEQIAVAQCYLETNDIDETAHRLQIPRDKVVFFLNKREVRKFIDTVFLEQGYFNKHKIQQTITNIIEKKLEELEEAEIGSNKDIADLLQMAHKMRMDELKLMQAAEKETTTIRNQTNVQVNGQFGENYNSLLSKLVDGNK